MTRTIFCVSFRCWLRSWRRSNYGADYGRRFPELERPSRRRTRSHRSASTPISFRPDTGILPFSEASSKLQPSRGPTLSTVQPSSQIAMASSMRPTHYSVTATPAGRRRYGFELSGPILSKKSGFALALEKRDINEFNVVNAVTLDANGGLGQVETAFRDYRRFLPHSGFGLRQRVGDWQVTPSNVASLSFSARCEQ